MFKRMRRLRRDERGATLIVVGVGFFGCMAASALAIDVGMFMGARTQAQNSADAGALAGAIALVFNDFDDRSSGGPAVTSARSAALANRVVGTEVSVNASDVTFPAGAAGVNNRVKVTVFRNQARNNAVPTLIGPMLGLPLVDISATATAEASPADAARCLMPFTIPDRWTENQTGPWDPNDDEFDIVDKKGNPVANPDVYIPANQTGYTGYNPVRDKGMQIVLKTNNLNKTAPSFYNPWAPPGSGGAEDYRNNIATCNTTKLKIGDLMAAEPGNMTGPTSQGTTDLVAKDPNAYWDTACNCVKGSRFSVSPRVATVPLYDPVYYDTGKTNGSNASLKIANLLGFFIEGMNGTQVVGRVTPITGLLGGGGGPTPAGAFAQVIRLVE
jgi:Flp pilus assembly protein TadG